MQKKHKSRPIPALHLFQRGKLAKHIFALNVLLVLFLIGGCDQNNKSQAPKISGQKHTRQFASLEYFTAKGITFKIPEEWKEPFARLIPLTSPQEVRIVHKGIEHTPSANVVYLAPNYRKNGALVQILLFDFDPQDFPIGLIAFSPQNWIPGGAELLSFPMGNEEIVAGPVAFGNVNAYKVRASMRAKVHLEDLPMEIIEDRYYCKEGLVFVVARFQARKNVFSHYDNSVFNDFLKNLKVQNQ